MSEERSRISLRSGPKRKGRSDRPVIGAPKQISGPLPQDNVHMGGTSATPIEPVPRPRPRVPPAAGGKTSDLVKRRYSTRFNNLPDDFNVTTPTVPTLPVVDPYKSRSRRQPPSRSGPAPVMDLNALRNPKLVPDQFVSSVLSDATEEQIEEFQASLRKFNKRAEKELHQNLVQNRTQFIKVSKEAEKLREDMRTLRNLMAELKSNTDALRAASMNRSETASASGRGITGLSTRNKQSSVADRSALWNSQMQALFKNVEGSQKFLPNVAGRHVVQNAGPWVELDNATYKSRRAMQIFLLNDHLLIASRKKRKIDGSAVETRGPPIVKLVADRCWPLLDVEVTDMPVPSEAAGGRSKLADAIMVRGLGQESFIYRTEKHEDPEKKTLLLNVRKASEELRKSLQSELEASAKNRDAANSYASRDPGLLEQADLLESLSNVKDVLIEVDGKQQNLRWVEGEMDELDIEIALQRFEPAVARVEKMTELARGLKNNAVAQDFIKFKTEERSAKLADMILGALELTPNQHSKTKNNVSWLTKLGFEDRARDRYFAARGETIRLRARQCVFEGDLHNYIWQLSFVYFTLIHNTVECYQACFPPPMMSSCVKWAKEQMEDFNVILTRQLSSTERDGPVWTRCLEQAKEHARQLAEVGLDFETMVGRGLGTGATAASAERPPGAGVEMAH